MVHKHHTLKGKEREENRTAEERAEDLAYTLNHAIACTVTDFIDPEVNKFVQNHGAKIAPKWLQPHLAKFHIGCGHDHSSAHNHGHAHGHGVTRFQVYAPEVIADFGSVPVVMAAQRFAPGFMHGIENAIEPVLGGAFHRSAESSTKLWANKHGIAYDSDAYKQHADEIYHHEVEHLPQAVIWTASTIGLNAVAQRALGSKSSWGNMIAGKSIGAAFTSGLVIGSRMLFPESIRGLDQWTTKNIVAPGTRLGGTIMGIDPNAIDKVLAEHDEVKDTKWKERVETKSYILDRDQVAEPVTSR